jgi:hypothetical protein
MVPDRLKIVGLPGISKMFGTNFVAHFTQQAMRIAASKPSPTPFVVVGGPDYPQAEASGAHRPSAAQGTTRRGLRKLNGATSF